MEESVTNLILVSTLAKRLAMEPQLQRLVSEILATSDPLVVMTNHTYVFLIIVIVLQNGPMEQAEFALSPAWTVTVVLNLPLQLCNV